MEEYKYGDAVKFFTSIEACHIDVSDTVTELTKTKHWKRGKQGIVTGIIDIPTKVTYNIDEGHAFEDGDTTFIKVAVVAVEGMKKQYHVLLNDLRPGDINIYVEPNFIAIKEYGLLTEEQKLKGFEQGLFSSHKGKIKVKKRFTEEEMLFLLNNDFVEIKNGR